MTTLFPFYYLNPKQPKLLLMAMDKTGCMCQTVIEINAGSNENVLWAYMKSAPPALNTQTKPKLAREINFV